MSTVTKYDVLPVRQTVKRRITTLAVKRAPRMGTRLVEEIFSLADVVEADEHARRIRKLLGDATIELSLRVAGLLLYAVLLTRILTLTIGVVEKRHDGTNIAFTRIILGAQGFRRH